MTASATGSLRPSLELPDTVRVGVTVPITIRLENRGTRPLDLHLTGRPIAFDLVVSDPEGRVLWRRMDDEVLSMVLQLRTLEPGTTEGLFRRVLLPLDGSEAAERLLRLTPPLVDPDEGCHVLLRAVPSFVGGGSPYLPHVVREAQEQEKVKEGAREYLEEVASGLRQRAGRVEVRAETGEQPPMAILRTAEEVVVDLIAMSTHGRGGVARLLLGSVADKVIRGAKVPVLLYREPEGE